MSKESLTKRFEEIIAKIEVKCSSTAHEIIDAVGNLYCMTGTETIGTKTSVIEQVKKVLQKAKISCPTAKDEIDELLGMEDEVVTVKCGGS